MSPRRSAAALAAAALLAGCGSAAPGGAADEGLRGDAGDTEANPNFLLAPDAPAPGAAAAAPAPATPARPPVRPALPGRTSGPAPAVPGRGALTVRLAGPAVLRARPGARRVLARLKRGTRFGSPQVLLVVARRGQWVGVLAAELRNGQVGWLDASRGVRFARVTYALEASLSRRLLLVRRDGRVLLRVPIAIGRPSTPTPRGRFAVSDKLLPEDPGGPYGCCILALTGHQPRLLQGWGGGDRLAIHATRAEQTIGQPASRGCLRAPSAVMRRLVREIPLGTPVQIRT